MTTRSLKNSMKKLDKSFKSISEEAKVAAEEKAVIEIDRKTGNNLGKSTLKVEREAEQALMSFVNILKVQQYDLFPGNEYPTPFTRIPIFTPNQRQKAREVEHEKTKNCDWIRLNSLWDKGGVYKSGPALTVYDEDTFLGILKSRKFRLKGIPSQMPGENIGKLTTISQNNEKDVNVHSGYFILSGLETTIKGVNPPKEGWGGKALQKRRESVERLGATILKFTQPQNLERYSGAQIQMLTIKWIRENDDSCYYFELPPAITVWMDEFRTYIDFKIRRKLTSFGKALHRFLCSQKSNKRFTKEWDVILTAIGYEGKISEANRKARSQLSKLISLDFIISGEIIGNGRSEPYKLEVVFKNNSVS